MAIVRKINGEIVLDDPEALGVIRAVEKHNCKLFLYANADRVQHFVNRIKEQGLSADEVVIVLLNVDDPNGKALAEVLMPGFNWQEIRDRGEQPVARGLASRIPLTGILETFDTEAASKLRDWKDIAVIVVDRGVAEIFGT